jgi:type III pantothenate kinase
MIKVNLLAASIGNTRTRLGAFVEGDLIEVATFQNQRDGKIADAIVHAFKPLQEKDDTIVLLSSVNADAAARVETQLEAYTRRPIQHVERDMTIPIGRQLDPEAMVGEDRLLNAAAAYDVLKQACVVVDAGTAITVDFVDGNGTFHGGAIAPGTQIMLDALNNRTAQLPEIDFAVPVEAIGHNTIEAMRTGIYYAMRGMVRELVEQYAKHAGTFPLVVVTGGDGNLLFRGWDLVDRVVPDLTLRGMAVTMRVAMEKQAEA